MKITAMTASFLTLTVPFLLGSGSALAAESTEATSTTTIEKTSTAPSSPTQVILGFKSTNTSARYADRNADEKSPSKGQNYNGKQEVFVGYKLRNNWGGFVQLTQTRQQYNEPTLNKWSVGDPSLSLIHPDLYQDSSLRIKGLFRVYLPFTKRSKNTNIRQYAYYSTQIVKFANGAEFSNQLIPRLFAADMYKDDDTRLYLEDRGLYSQQINSWSRWGLGAWAQVEQHAKDPTGYSLEVIPQVDFILNSNTFVGPRIAMPVFSQNSVYDGPRGASLDEARAELFFQMSL